MSETQNEGKVYEITYSIKGGTYDDGIRVNGVFLFSVVMRRVYRAIVDGRKDHAFYIRDHLLDLGFEHTRRQISNALQSLKHKGLLKYNGRWNAV